MVRRAAAVAIALALSACGAPGDKRRAVHAGATAAGAVTYVAAETVFKDDLGPEPCRWCEPNAVDRGARDALRWDDPGLGDSLSDATAFYLAPITGIGLLVFETRGERDVRRWVDDALPVVEVAVITGLLHQVVRLSVARQRPFVHYAEPGRAPDSDDNVSFYSGHTQLAFAVVTSAGTVARLRGYDVEPWIWGVGLPIAAATGYLRIAADKHYLVDVSTGALVGTAAGLLLPRLLLADTERPIIVPAPGGVAIVGAF